MASTKEYLDFVLEQLSGLDEVSFRAMMGEYILYKDGKIFGGVYDNRFLVKKAAGLEKYHMKEQIPYPTAKPMFLIDSEDPEEIQDIVSIIAGK